MTQSTRFAAALGRVQLEVHVGKLRYARSGGPVHDL